MPFLTLKVIGAIHWHALRMWWKGFALRPRPPKPAWPVTDGHGRGLGGDGSAGHHASPVRTFGHFPPALSLVLRRTLLHLLRRIETGALTVTLPSGATIHHRGARPGPEGVLVVRRWRALLRLLLAGDLGLARAYMDDDCRSPDIQALLEFGAANARARSKLPSDVPLARSLDRIRHALRANTRTRQPPQHCRAL